MASATSNIHTISLASQVGGHAGVLTTEDGELLIKPALQCELEFYQRLQSDASLSSLRPFIPKFVGTLRLEGELDEAKLGEGIAVKPSSVSDKKDKCSLLSIVLENISYRFKKPNILDIKLGTVLYDDQASPEKVARMIETAKNTTSLETGVRLTGFQVYDNATGLAVITPKSYGKSIKAADLLDGIMKFFPEAKEGSETSAEASNGLQRAVLRPILEGIIKDVKEIRETFAELELRMVGGSLLIVYEADWDKAKEGLQNIYEEEVEGEEEEETDDEREEDEKGLPFAVKLIDFAHTKVVPGQGPDEGVLLGMDTTIRLLNERLLQLL